MTKRIKATINPAVLTWARETAGFDITAAAAKIDVDEEKLAAWETGDDQPSIPQLRKLAEAYKRPLAVLYLPEPPTNSFQAMHDFRRLPDLGMRSFSPELTLEIRLAQQRRELALELFEDGDETPAPFKVETTIATNPETAAAALRDALGVDYDLQSHWRDVAPRGRRDQADRLIMPDHWLRHAARPRGLADVHRATRLSRRALETTLTEDRAIAAAAIIGESRIPNTG